MKEKKKERNPYSRLISVTKTEDGECLFKLYRGGNCVAKYKSEDFRGKPVEEEWFLETMEDFYEN